MSNCIQFNQYDILVALNLIYFICSVYPKWEFSHITLSVRNLLDLKIFYRDLLKPSIPFAEWSLQCKKILLQKHSPLCQHVLRKGQTPTPLRGEFWSYVLGSHNFKNVMIFIFFFFFFFLEHICQL